MCILGSVKRRSSNLAAQNKVRKSPATFYTNFILEVDQPRELVYEMIYCY